MAEINIPDYETSALKAIDERELDSLIDQAIQEGQTGNLSRLPLSAEQQFMATLANAVLPKYQGWALREVRRRTDEQENPNKFPFDYDSLLPWMGRINRLAEAKGGELF
ncbi:hypothetical protein GR198_07185 [Rhizobium leguminosarum]|uniref:hypothetical protein n=1 Tax=Rhizobium leguminosarum TaxID=384 RepID=UPI0013C145D9|nr:hypothetical protein [Rhizobium leguminosarum]NEH55530.1 hypothetical protein [Rhizobium leguminosarum]